MLKKSVISFLIILAALIVLVFSFGPGVLENQFNKMQNLGNPPASAKAKALHNRLIVGDWHADSTLWSRDLSKRGSRGHVDIPRLQDGNVALQMFTTVTKSPSGLNYEKNDTQASDNITKIAMLQRWPVKSWSSLTERAIYQAEKLLKLAEEHGEDFMLIRSQQELATFLEKRAINKDFVGGLIGTEGSHALDGKLSNIEVLYNKGFRMMSLHHFFDNKLGGSLHGEEKSGLTEFGAAALRKMRTMNIMVDLSHSSEQVVRDVMEIDEGPYVISHTGFQGHCQTPRNISDQLMQKIALNGGLIAVGYWDAAVCDITIESIAKAIKYGVSLVGEDHVALGSDYDGATTMSFDTSELDKLTQALLEQGLTEQQIAKVMGGNMLTFLQNHLPKA